MRKIMKPENGEFPSYASMYIDLLPNDQNILSHLKKNFDEAKKFISSIPQQKLLFRYAPDKWTIKEILVHIIDDERIYAYRAMCFARNEKTPLPGFEEKEYAKFSRANERDLTNILDEYEAVRNSTIALFNGLPEESLTRIGTANENQTSVRALVYHIAGHELHHLNIIKERYL